MVRFSFQMGMISSVMRTAFDIARHLIWYVGYQAGALGPVRALLAREPRGEHVPPVGERLDPVEDARRRERHGGEAQGGPERVERLEDPDPPATAGEHDADGAVGVLVAAGTDERLRLGAHA